MIGNQKERIKFERTLTYKAIAQKFLQEVTFIDDYVLNVGCGFGLYTDLIKLRCKCIVGVDVEKFFEPTSSAGMNFCLADGFRLPFKDESFGGATLFDVIEHVTPDSEFLLEVKRVLKKGGLLFLETPNVERLFNKLKQMLYMPEQYPLNLGEHPVLGSCVHVREYTKKELLELLRRLGFESIKVQGVLGISAFSLSHFPKFLERFSLSWLATAIKPYQ